MSIERRSTTGKISSDGNRLSGLASPTYQANDPGTQYDLFGDGSVMERFAPGAFDECLKTQPDVIALYNHDSNVVLGRTPETLQIRADTYGVHYSIDMPDTQAARDLKVSVNRGDISGASFAFIAKQITWERDGKADVRMIRRATLHDVSLCTRPAYGSSTAVMRSTEERADIIKERDEFKQKLNTEKWQDKIQNLK